MIAREPTTNPIVIQCLLGYSQIWFGRYLVGNVTMFTEHPTLQCNHLFFLHKKHS